MPGPVAGHTGGSRDDRVASRGSGWSGGALGAHKAKKAFEAATQRVGSALHGAGLVS